MNKTVKINPKFVENNLENLIRILESPFTSIRLFNNSYPKKPMKRSVLVDCFLFFFVKKLLIFLLFKIIFFEKSV